MKLTRLDYTIAGLALALMLTALPSCTPQRTERNLYLECKNGDTPSFNYDRPATMIYETDGTWKITDGYDEIGVYKQKQGELCVVVKRDGELL